MFWHSCCMSAGAAVAAALVGVLVRAFQEIYGKQVS